MQFNRKFQRGFTLVEMIVVMVITGILGGIVALFIRGPVQGYIDSARRAEMNDIADTAMSRITRDLRLALPNSARITGANSGANLCNGTETCYLEFIPVKGGGRYRAQSPGNVLNIAPTSTSSFDVLGAMPSFVAGDSVVIDNLSAASATAGTVPNDAYNVPASNVAAVNVAGTTATTVSLSPAALFPSASPGNRFQVIPSTAVTYVCSPVAGGTLTRYWGYAIQAAQPVSIAAVPLSTATNALLATNVSWCKFSLPQAGLVDMQLILTENGESVSLYDEAHVANAP